MTKILNKGTTSDGTEVLIEQDKNGLVKSSDNKLIVTADDSDADGKISAYKINVGFTSVLDEN